MCVCVCVCVYIYGFVCVCVCVCVCIASMSSTLVSGSRKKSRGSCSNVSCRAMAPVQDRMVSCNECVANVLLTCC